MARPRKQVVDYFPHDADFSVGRIGTCLLNKHGAEGYAFWFLLQELLGRSPGHLYNFNEPDDWEFLLAETHISATETAKDILKTLGILRADNGRPLLDPELLERGVIWSQDFVDRVEDVYKKRKESKPERPNSVAETPVSPTQTEVPGGENPQTKQKETKQKERKGNKTNSVSSSLNKEDKEKLNKEADRVLAEYYKYIGRIGAPTRSEVEATVLQYGSNWIIDAIGVAVAQGQKKWRYVLGVLKNWGESGSRRS